MHLHRLGFTLIELLVVISIMAALASMLLGAVTTVKAAADQTTCLNQLRQFGMATAAYLDDGDGRFPPASIINGQNWRSLTASYLYEDQADANFTAFSRTISLYSCRAALKDHPINISKMTYGQNVYTDPGQPLERRSACRTSSTALLISDGHWDSDASGWWATNLVPLYATPVLPNTPHRGTCSCLYVDGHVASLAGKAIPLDPFVGSGITFWLGR